MIKNLGWLGSAAGLVGVLVCLVSGAARVLGVFYIMDFQSTTVFDAGIGLMVFACLVKLEVLARRTPG